MGTTSKGGGSAANQAGTARKSAPKRKAPGYKFDAAA